MANGLAYLTDEQVQELLQLYEEKNTSSKELAAAYNLHEASMYALLRQHGVVPHSKRPENRKTKKENKNGRVKITKLPPEEFAAVEDEFTSPIYTGYGIKPKTAEIEEVPVIHTGAVEVVVDKENLVQSTTRYSSRRLHTWEIHYSGTVLVEADEIEEAIKEARKLGVVKRIHSVTEKKE